MKVLHIEPLRCNTETRKLLEDNVELLDFAEVGSQEELIQKLREQPYEALFVRLGIATDSAVFDAAPFLKYIVTPTTGLDHIDVVAAQHRDIEVISLRGETAFLKSIKSTAEHTWALLLALIRHLPEAIADVQKGNWRREPFLASELNGKTLGIIGYGRLGSIVAEYGKAFGMTVLVNDTDAGQLQDISEGVAPVGLETLLQKSDIISLHIPSNTANYRFFDAQKIAQTRPGVIIVNTARGEIIAEEALLAGLESGHIAGAALDVVNGDSSWSDQVPEGHPLVRYAAARRNLIITAHMGGYGKESIENTRLFIARKFLKNIQSEKNLLHG